MPPKRSATVPPAAPVSPVEPDDHSDSHDDAEQPVITREEYNALVNSYQETLQRVQELEARNAAHAPSSQTSLEPEEQAPTPAPPEVPYRGFNPDPRVDAPPNSLERSRNSPISWPLAPLSSPCVQTRTPNLKVRFSTSSHASVDWR